MTTQKSIQAARETIKNCGMSTQNGYEWNCTVEQYEELREAAADGLFRGTYQDPETALKTEAIRLGIAQDSDFEDGDEEEDDDEDEEVYKGYVRTNTGEVLVQVPDPESYWGFYLADEEQSWDGGLGILASAFEAISESEASEEDKERLGWILSQ